MNYIILSLALAATVPAYAVDATIGAKDCLVINANPQPKETVQWSGPCKDGYADGVGTLAWFVDGKPNGSYEGSMVRGRRHGDGYIQQADGTQYEGGMREGKRHGKGSVMSIDRSRYDGEWKDDERDGTGTARYSTGGRYEGQWKNGRFHGKGKASYIGGQVVEGEFRDGLPVDQPPPATALERKDYSLKADNGGKIRYKIVSGGAVPFQKSYARMTVEEQQGVRRRYPMLHPDDEPPFPLLGDAHFHEMLAEAHYELEAEGLLIAHVLVDSEGVATSVKVFKSPSPAMTTVVTILLMKEKFKPGLCAGTPCPMPVPVRVRFGGAST